MDTQPWLDQLRAELARRKLPPHYVERLVGELSDHLTDLMEDRMSTDAKDLRGLVDRLGMPVQLASVAAENYRRKRFSKRHPVLSFIVLPILMMPVLWSVGIIVTLLVVKSLGFESGAVLPRPLTQAALSAMPLVVMGILLVPVAVAAMLFCRLAAKAGVSWKWTLTACALIAILGGAAATEIALPVAGDHGSLSFGFGIRSNPSAQQLLQFTLPLAICAWAILRQWRQNRAIG